MKLIEQALAALAFAENRYHELVDPVGQIIENVKALAKATAGHVQTMEARLVQAEADLARMREVLNEVSGGAWTGLVPEPDPTALELGAAVRAAGEEKFVDVDKVREELAQVPAAPPVMSIPLSPDIAAAVEAAPATEPAPS